MSSFNKEFEIKLLLFERGYSYPLTLLLYNFKKFKFANSLHTSEQTRHSLGTTFF